MSKPTLLDSISSIDASHIQTVIVSGSHGGVSAARFVLSQAERPYAVFFNDAGVGKQEAGIAALKLLDAAGVAAATYSHNSACIGNAQDAWDQGKFVLRDLRHSRAGGNPAGTRFPPARE